MCVATSCNGSAVDGSVGRRERFLAGSAVLRQHDTARDGLAVGVPVAIELLTAEGAQL